MTASKKKRMSMLDSLATAGTPAAPGSMMSTNRALRSARDAVDAHHVWELDPDEIEDGRVAAEGTHRHLLASDARYEAILASGNERGNL